MDDLCEAILGVHCEIFRRAAVVTIRWDGVAMTEIICSGARISQIMART
jgi:hypothetical protein